ncbi:MULTISPECIES: hypothetical protein [Bifidobacterium]|uniref:Uncharacterized protein n=2 Tax=Bifidobacterium TaxID=1678 RepID=A0A261FTE8_9BIFI|nr:MULTISPECIES: hypothetical protein [Bifidobacterium]OZG62471.1 hypothetical protein BLEM_1017 [Bifidobacterium lemurum]OZG69007.1 hypothetical protein BEUL_0413 [Bifidobacterium eulemuris]QOL31464.1 hypothetical protein BE0216_02565 [Bifidobacterium eulemuris]QOL33813.1 hypothetical protein BL8807_08515 [Bifidobacterium lemurum]
MAKPSERNRAMRELADESVDAEIEALRAKRDSLRAVGVKLDDLRWAIEQFRVAADDFIATSGSTRRYLQDTLKIDKREMNIVWPPTGKRKNEASDEPQPPADQVESQDHGQSDYSVSGESGFVPGYAG